MTSTPRYSADASMLPSNTQATQPGMQSGRKATVLLRNFSSKSALTWAVQSLIRVDATLMSLPRSTRTPPPYKLDSHLNMPHPRMSTRDSLANTPPPPSVPNDEHEVNATSSSSATPPLTHSPPPPLPPLPSLTPSALQEATVLRRINAWLCST
eukprot:6177216-Pleurochrysis_carterae.AAC.4